MRSRHMTVLLVHVQADEVMTHRCNNLSARLASTGLHLSAMVPRQKGSIGSVTASKVHVRGGPW
jgi:hypothetical protein